MLATAVLLANIAKLKRGLGPAFGAHFLHDFSIKMFFIWYSYNGQNFNVTPYFVLKISSKMCYLVLTYTVDGIINFKILFGSTAKAMADREKTRGRWNTKTWISPEQKELFRWNKKHFSYFSKGYHLVINKNLIKNSRHKL